MRRLVKLGLVMVLVAMVSVAAMAALAESVAPVAVGTPGCTHET